MQSHGTVWRSSLLLLSVFFPSAVLAESAPPPCEVGSIWPRSGDVAADHPAFVIPSYGAHDEHETTFELWETVGEAEPTLVVSTTRSVFADDGHVFVVEPSVSLTLGASVELRGDTCPMFPSLGDVSVMYRVTAETGTPPAPPLRLATSVVAYAHEGYLYGFNAVATLTVEGGGVIEEWRPWFRTEVGIGTTPPRSRTGTGRDATESVALACEGFEGIGIPPGDHPITGALRTFDGDSLGEVSEVARFDCADARYMDYSGRELSAAEVAGLRRRPPIGDASVPQDAGGFSQDAGPDDEVGSSGCSAGAGAGASSAAWMLALAALRRRRSRA